MGWGRTLFLGDIGNRMDIGDCERDIVSLRQQLGHQTRADQSQDEQIRRLQQENGELKLYLASMIRLLISKNVFTQDEFARFVDVIDQSDGASDGQFSGGLGG